MVCLLMKQQIQCILWTFNATIQDLCDPSVYNLQVASLCVCRPWKEDDVYVEGQEGVGSKEGTCWAVMKQKSLGDKNEIIQTNTGSKAP